MPLARSKPCVMYHVIAAVHFQKQLRSHHLNGYNTQDDRRFMHKAIRKDFAMATEIMKWSFRMCFTLETLDDENYKTLLWVFSNQKTKQNKPFRQLSLMCLLNSQQLQNHSIKSCIKFINRSQNNLHDSFYKPSCTTLHKQVRFEALGSWMHYVEVTFLCSNSTYSRNFEVLQKCRLLET